MNFFPYWSVVHQWPMVDVAHARLLDLHLRKTSEALLPRNALRHYGLCTSSVVNRNSMTPRAATTSEVKRLRREAQSAKEAVAK